MAKNPPIPPFPSGDSLFVFEGDRVRVLGEEGTEATVPLEDLKALLEHIAEAPAPPTTPPSLAPPGLLLDKDEE
jgi:hypothetical protein